MNSPLRFLTTWKNALKEYEKDEEDRDSLKKIIFCAIKTMANKHDPVNKREAESDFQVHSSIKYFVSKLTPNEFMQMFPITKYYKGYKFGMKDYWSTMEFINTLECDEPLGDNTLMFLMEYSNRDIEAYTINQIMCTSRLREFDGHLHLFEEFMAADGHETTNTFKNSKGEPMYVRHGKPEKIKRLNNLQLI